MNLLENKTTSSTAVTSSTATTTTTTTMTMVCKEKSEIREHFALTFGQRTQNSEQTLTKPEPFIAEIFLKLLSVNVIHTQTEVEREGR